MKNLLNLFFSCLILLSTAYGQWIPIDSIRMQDANGVPLLINQTVTTRGVVTTTREFGNSLVYFQVATAGLVAFDATFCTGVKRGDSIEATGVITQFNGLTEFNPVNSFTIFDTGKTVSPIDVTCSQVRIGGEQYEGMLIRISNVTAVHTTAGANATTWTVTGSGTNYRILVGNDSCEIRIYATSNIANQPIAPFPFNVTALCSQFSSSPPLNSGYQILPRRLDDFTGVTGISAVSNNIPDKYNLQQNYPNPFNPRTVIRYQLAVSSYASLKVYDVLGNEVATLVNEKQNAGSYKVEFDGSVLSSGVYIYKLISENFFNAKSMVLIK